MLTSKFILKYFISWRMFVESDALPQLLYCVGNKLHYKTKPFTIITKNPFID